MSMLATFTETFRAEVRSHITSVSFGDILVFLGVVKFNTTKFSSGELSNRCSTKCDLIGGHRGLVHNIFHHVRRVIIEDDAEYGSVYGLHQTLVKGASWLSVMMGFEDVEEVLRTFSNLKEIVVRWGDGEQVSYIVGGNIYAGESGMLMGGEQDWLPAS